MTLRIAINEFSSMLDDFKVRAGRNNATVTTLQGALAAAIATGDRALDVKDPIELSRGYEPPKVEPVPPVVPADPVGEVTQPPVEAVKPADQAVAAPPTE